MIAAGLPNTEIENHAKEVTDVALQMMIAVNNDQIQLGTIQTKLQVIT